MYMANVKILHWGPNATYIPLAHVGGWVGGNANFTFCVGGNANFSVFRYQHDGIPNAKFHVGGLSQSDDPTQVFLRCSGI